MMARNRKRPALRYIDFGVLTDQQRISRREFGTLPTMQIGTTIIVKRRQTWGDRVTSGRERSTE